MRDKLAEGSRSNWIRMEIWHICASYVARRARAKWCTKSISVPFCSSLIVLPSQSFSNQPADLMAEAMPTKLWVFLLGLKFLPGAYCLPDRFGEYFHIFGNS